MTAATASTVTIEVTQEHIDNGESCKSYDCPVALAVLAAIPGARRVAVNYGGDYLGDAPQVVARVITDRGDMWLALGQAATRFVDAIDEGGPAGPFTFEAEVLPS